MDDIVILTRSKNSSWEQEFVTYLIHKWVLAKFIFKYPNFHYHGNRGQLESCFNGQPWKPQFGTKIYYSCQAMASSVFKYPCFYYDSKWHWSESSLPSDIGRSQVCITPLTWLSPKSVRLTQEFGIYLKNDYITRSFRSFSFAHWQNFGKCIIPQFYKMSVITWNTASCASDLRQWKTIQLIRSSAHNIALT